MALGNQVKSAFRGKVRNLFQMSSLDLGNDGFNLCSNCSGFQVELDPASAASLPGDEYMVQKPSQAPAIWKHAQLPRGTP